jgi:hypothetical protein
MASPPNISLTPLQHGVQYPVSTFPAQGAPVQHGGTRPPTPPSPRTQTGWAPPYPPPDMNYVAPFGSYVPATPPFNRFRKSIPKDEVEDKPWKYCGYRGFSAWLASSEDAVILRRFNRLHARVILHMQWKITWYEDYLEALDLQHIRRQEDVENNSFNDHDNRRTDVLNQLQVLLKEYGKCRYAIMRVKSDGRLDDFILSHRQLRSNPQAEDYQVKNVKNFFHNNGHDEDGNGAIASKETEFIKEDGDLVALVPKSKTLLRRGLDKLESWRTFFPFNEPVRSF